MSDTIDVKVLAQAMREVMNPSKAQQAQMAAREPGRPHERIPCVSPTGAKFNAVVASSKEFPDFGRVKALEDYEYPENPFPPNMTNVYALSSTGEVTTNLTAEAKSYLYQTTYKVDLTKYVGQQFDIQIRADLQDKVRAIRAEQESRMRADLAALSAPEIGTPAAPTVAKSK